MPKGREAKLMKLATKTANGARKLPPGGRNSVDIVALVNEALLEELEEEAHKRAMWLDYKRAVIEARVAEYLKNKNK